MMPNSIYFQRGTENWKKSNKQSIGNMGAYILKWSEINGAPQFDKKIKKQKSGKLISFWTAVARVQDGEFYMNRIMDQKPLILSSKELKSIEKLNFYRNEFTHFIPTSYAMSIEEFKEICFNTIRPIEFLAFEANHFIYYEGNQKERIQSAISKLKDLLK